MSDLGSRLANLTPEKRALLALRLRGRGGINGPGDRILSREDPNVYPMSFAQQRLWFLDQLSPGNHFYNVPGALRLSGPLDIAALGRCLNEIIRRHEVLRSVYSLLDGNPVQSVIPAIELPLPVIDLQDVPEHERWDASIRHATEEARRPFDLRIGPLVRAQLIRLSPADHVLLVTFHHIVFDGWSTGVLFKEMSSLYGACTRGENPTLPDLPIQYADYAAWQRAPADGEGIQKQVAYWKARLADALSPLELPTNHPRPAVQTFSGAHHGFTLSVQLSQDLRRLSASEGATLFMTLLSAFQLLLHRYSGQRVVNVGVPIANRTRAEVQNLVGFFVNTVVMRSDVSSHLSYREFLHQVRQAALEAYTNQDAPFDRVVEEVLPERELSHTPLYQVMFNLEELPLQAMQLGELRASAIDVETGTAKCDLALVVREGKPELCGYFEYNTGLFDESTVRRMVGHLETLLASIVEDPERPLADQDMLSAPEREQLVVEWNQTARSYSQDRCIHELFEARVSAQPDEPAIVDGGVTLTYAELNARANQIAHYLRRCGVSPAAPVPIYMQRSSALVTGILAILKSGGSYVPFDPESPDQRLAFMLDETQAKVVVTQSALAGNIPIEKLGSLAPRVICLDADRELLSRESEEKPSNRTIPDCCAYIIYTSGSTGMPKGVCCQHAGVISLLENFEHLQPLSRGEHCSWCSTQCFDVSVYEIFSALLFGGTLYIVPDGVRAESAAFFQWLRENTIQSFYLPPFMVADFAAWLEENNEGYRCRRLLVGVEPIHEHLLVSINTHIPSLHIINAYGPTEITVCCTLYPFSSARAQNRNTPIGRPVWNAQIYVLNQHLQPVPINVSGEVCVGGLGLAHGYFRRPDITAERFVPDPFGTRPGARLYRTGDQARFHPDGNLEFIGRKDFQVKVRGHRIELGEIEAVLSQHPAVRKSVVLVWELPMNADGAQRRTDRDKAIVAYVVPVHAGNVTAKELREFARRMLPEYMMPSVIMLMESLPLTPNGKVDRRALPPPEHERLEPGEPSATPRGAVQELLGAVWSKVLGIDQIGVNENFFEIGGHSLLATQAISRIREIFHCDLPLRTIFERPTIAELAALVEDAGHVDRARAKPPLERLADGAEFVLSFAQQRLWFLDQLEPGSAQYHIAGSVRLKGLLNAATLEDALNAVAQRHASLRTTFPTVDGKGIQKVSPSIVVKAKHVDGRDWPEAERDEKARQMARDEARIPFDLASGPLVRMLVIRMAEDVHIVVFIMHHIISDGWSMAILIRELAAMYRSIATGEDPALPDLPFQYADYAQWQREWLTGDFLSEELAFWKHELAGAPQQLALPTDHPRPEILSTRGAQYRFEVPAPLAQAVKEMSRSEGTTLFMTLLAAFQLLLSRYAEEDDICVGMPIANRGLRETEDMVGLFVNTIVVRTDLSGNPTVRDLLRRVRDVCLRAYSHQDVPFEKVVDALEPERNMSRTPLFQVMFVLQNTPAGILDLPGMIVEPLEIDAGVSPFDMTLAMEEKDGQLTGGIEYNSDLFQERTIERFCGHFVQVLEGLVASPLSRIDRITMMPDEERQRITSEWNATTKEFSPVRCIHHLVEQQVVRTPDAIAVKHGTRCLTYRELNAAANRLARRLRRLGVAPEDRIGISVDPSIAALVGLLGILKSGGAFVPLDPHLPAERFSYVIADSGMKLLLTQKGLASRDSNLQIQTVRLDEDESGLGSGDEENPVSTTEPESLAYVIYTSGTTGRPKGVLVSHRSVTNHNQAAVQAFALTGGDRVLQFASLSFDASLEEIFPAWMSGAAVVLRTDDALGAGEEFLAFIGREQITVLDLPTTFWSEWVHSMRVAGLSLPQCVRLVVAGGDAVPPDRFVEWMVCAGPGVRWVNTYGPTEATIIATLFDPGAVPSGFGDPTDIPIGRPLPNTAVFLLDRNLQPAPIGMPGEIYIGGEGVARGYHGRPDLTASRFVPDPFSSRGGSRLYRTGDRGCFLPDGNIRFLGRLDDQVKIRGFRVEPGEVASIIAAHPVIKEAVVLARKGEGGKRLVAYCVKEPGQLLTPEQLLGYLADRVPDYMVPRSIVMMDSFPHTPGGKIDRRELPEPQTEETSAPDGYVAPRTPAEKTIADIWQQVLGVQRVGVTENFFELGGDSILSIQVISRARQAGLRITPKDIFVHPTVGSLAGAARNVAESRADQGTVTGAVPLTPIQHWFFEQPVEERHHWNQSVLLEVRRPLDVTVLENVVGTLIRHHDALRSRFRSSPHGWEQVIQAREDETPFTSLDLSTVVPGKEREVIEEKTSGFQRSLDLHKGPVVRVVYFYLGNERPARLLFVVHHLVIDGVSWRILLEDFAATYEFLSQGKPAAMQPKTTSFKEWSERLREYATSGLLKDETRYWGTLHRMRWKSAPLPVDFPDGENTYGSTKRIVVTFSNEETRALIHDVPKILHAQVNDILLTALARACYRWTGKTALLLDLEGHGREQLWEDIDLSRTIGWFTSLFPIMLDIGRHGHWKDALLLVQNQLRRLPGNGLGFGVIRFLSPDQKLAEKIRDIPQPGMSFNYLGQFDGLVPQDSMFRLAPELPGPERAPGGRRANMLDFMARVIEGKLEVVLEYSRNLHRDDTMSSLVQNFMDEIRLMLGEVSSVRVPDAAGPDIEMVGLSAQELEIVLDEAKGTPHHAREHRKRGY